MCVCDATTQGSTFDLTRVRKQFPARNCPFISITVLRIPYSLTLIIFNQKTHFRPYEMLNKD